MTPIKLSSHMLPQSVSPPAVTSPPSRATLWGVLGAWLLITFGAMWALNPIGPASLDWCLGLVTGR